MHTPTTSTALSTPASCLWRRVMAAILALGLLALAGPTSGYAQETMNAQALTPEGVALTAAELGPEWSLVAHNTRTLEDGTHLSYMHYSAPSGRVVNLTTAVAVSPEYAEAVISYLRYQFESEGFTISSVQNNGFGDGRAFKAEGRSGDLVGVLYMFRVRNLIAAVDYAGSAAAGDVQTPAINVARKQEAKLFATFAPPPPTPTPAPTAVPTPTPMPTAVVAPVASAPDPAGTQTAPYCQPGEQPQFRLGFATLSAQLGARMGNPLSCQYTDPGGSGDTLQATDTGLAIYRVGSDTTTFTNGSEHWALVGGHVVHWSGDSLDPPDDADTVAA